MKAQNRTIGMIMLTLAVLLTSTQAHADRLRKLKIGDEFPAFILQKLGGGMISHEDYQGKVQVIVFLSAEQNSSEQAAIDARDVVANLQSEDIQLLYVSADIIYSSYFEKFRDDSKLSSPIGFDAERELYGTIGLIVLPTTVIIDREGKLARVISIWKSDYAQTLDSYARHTLGMINDHEMKELLTAMVYNEGTPKSRASRHRAVARLLREKGLFENAEQELRAARDLDPENVNTKLDLASLLLAVDRRAEASDIVTAVLDEYPDRRRALLLRGIVLYRDGDFDEAEPLFKKLLVLNPDPAKTHFYLGRIYEQKGDKDQALFHYREALARYTEDAED